MSNLTDEGREAVSAAARAAHIARAERLLADAEWPQATADAALLAVAHAFVALVRHEVGVWDETTTTEGDR